MTHNSVFAFDPTPPSPLNSAVSTRLTRAQLRAMYGLIRSYQATGVEVTPSEVLRAGLELLLAVENGDYELRPTLQAKKETESYV